MKKAISLLLLAALAALTLASCNSEDDSVFYDFDYAYPYPSEGYGGAEFRILNMNDFDGLHSAMEREELTGETLDDAIYTRNRLVEQQLDIVISETIVEETPEFNAVTKVLRPLILAGETQYDAMFIPLSGAALTIREGFFYNLNEIDTVQLDQPWWYQSFNDALSFYGMTYGAAGSANLTVCDAANVLVFNCDLMEDLKLKLPYNLVREGNWTLDEFHRYITAAADLNGNIVGYCQSGQNVQSFLTGSGEMFFQKEENTIAFDRADERFCDVVEKLSDVLYAADDEADAFPSGGALFVQSGIYQLPSYAGLDFEYSLVPFPKYDENQESYYSSVWEGGTIACIPVTSVDVKLHGLILDAMACEGKKSVVPAFWEGLLEQDGMRSKDTASMLKIVAGSLVPPYSEFFRVGTELVDDISSDIWYKSGAAPLLMADYEQTIQSELAKLLEFWK
ncbi:MAG: hypothetical protein IJ493_02625 [Clostridia bacterium]|nr:hypothetical protein [Clostridia bacterium]